MKRFFFGLCLLICGLSVQAKVDSYKCFSTEGSYKEITVQFDKCELTASTQFDICRVKKSKLIIAVDPRHSVLVSRKGETQEFSCSELNEGETSYSPASTPAPNAPRTAPGAPGGSTPGRTEADPGHGGSNIRMRGMKIEE